MENVFIFLIRKRLQKLLPTAFLVYFPIQFEGKIYIMVDADAEAKMTKIEISFLKTYYNFSTLKVSPTQRSMARNFNINYMDTRERKMM